MPKTAKPSSNIASIILPGVIGNALECYDFSLYGYFAPTIAQLFFPQAAAAISLIATFAIFATGFMMRPLGAIIFAHCGDKWGRKKVLASAIIIMALSTALIGMLPTYAQIGPAAGYLLTACRLLQGLAIGGEFAGSIVYIVEHAPNNRRGFYSSLAMMSMIAGMLLSSAVAALAEHFLSTEWAWRVPFLLGLLVGAVGLYLRIRMPETPLFKALQHTQQIIKAPVWQALRQMPLTLLKTTLLDCLPAVGFYLLFVYLSSYLHLYYSVPLSLSLTINSLALFVVVILTPLIGHCSDRIGRKPFIRMGTLAMMVLAYPLFLLLAKATFFAILSVQICFAILLSCCCATLPALLAESYPTQLRYTGVALPYNLCNAFLGGTAPLLVTLWIHHSQNILAPSFYLILAAVVSLLALVTIKETHTGTLK